MTRRLATLTLNLYPLAFRRRYGREMRALIEESPARFTTLLDLLRGALGAHLRPPGGLDSFVDASDRLRASASGVLACWVIFAVAGLGFYKTTEDREFSTAGNAHLVLGGAHVAVQALALVASLAVVIGAMPLIAAALGHARRELGLRVLVSLPVVAVIVFALLTGGLVLLAHGDPARHATAAHVASIAWILAGLACGAVCVVATRKALFAVPLAHRHLGSALAWGALVTAAMAVITVAVGVYAVALVLDASNLAAAQNGPSFISTSAWLSLTMQAIVMAMSATLATVTTLRGWRAARSSASQTA
jgi:hypothetical protein